MWNPVACYCGGLVLVALLLSACGGGGSPAPVVSARTTANQITSGGPGSPTGQGATPPSEAGSPLAAIDRAEPGSPEEASRLARLKSLALLAVLSDREKLGLLRQIALASPSRRLSAIESYAKLAMLADRQKQILLGQLEDIAPVVTPTSALVCECGSDITRKICVRESCADGMELQSVCNRACGTLASFRTQCSASPQCSVR